MPVLMQNTERKALLESAMSSKRIWRQRVVGQSGELMLSLPETGSFEVFFVALQPADTTKSRHSAREMIGFGKRFHSPRSSAEWMKELREGAIVPQPQDNQSIKLSAMTEP